VLSRGEQITLSVGELGGGEAPEVLQLTSFTFYPWQHEKNNDIKIVDA